MKTIFIICAHPIISRNILTPAFFQLMDNTKLVLLVPAKKKQYFVEQFAADNVIIEPFERGLFWQDRLLKYFALASLDTNSLRIKRITEMRGQGRVLNKFIGGVGLARYIIRKLTYLLTPECEFPKLIEKYKPDAVFSTDIQNEYDIRMLCSAKRLGIKTIGMTRSWDNLTSKGMVRFVPDKFLVQNEILKGEAINLCGISSSIIEMTGIPHYDLYLSGAHSSREDFFRRIGGDPNKRLVLFTPTGDRYIKENNVDKEILESLDENLPEEYQILVRFPPTDSVRGLDGRINQGRVIYDRPAGHFNHLKKEELTHEDDMHLIDSLYFSDLVVTGPSTICIDAAMFDKPIVLTGFDGVEKRTYYESVLRFYDYEHWRPILASEGAPIAKSKQELINIVKEYLADSGKDSVERKKLAEEQCWKLDGKSTERVADKLKGA